MLLRCEFRELLRRAALIVLCLMLGSVLLQTVHAHTSSTQHSDCPACIASHHAATPIEPQFRMPELARTDEQPPCPPALRNMQVEHRNLFIRPPPAVV
jgi:hypothetical protein